MQWLTYLENLHLAFRLTPNLGSTSFFPPATPTGFPPRRRRGGLGGNPVNIGGGNIFGSGSETSDLTTTICTSNFTEFTHLKGSGGWRGHSATLLLLLLLQLQLETGQLQRGRSQRLRVRFENLLRDTYPPHDRRQVHDGGDVGGGAGVFQRPPLVHPPIQRTTNILNPLVAGAPLPSRGQEVTRLHTDPIISR